MADNTKVGAALVAGLLVAGGAIVGVTQLTGGGGGNDAATVAPARVDLRPDPGNHPECDDPLHEARKGLPGWNAGLAGIWIAPPLGAPDSWRPRGYYCTACLAAQNAPDGAEEDGP